MSSTSPEAEFHSRLYVRLNDYLNEDTEVPFHNVSIEEQTESGRADVYLESYQTASTIIEVKREDIDPRAGDVVKQARDYARAVDAEFFATCNKNDFFLYDYRGEIDLSDIEFYYINMRNTKVKNKISDILDAITHLFEQDRLPQQNERQRIVGTLRSFHSSVWPSFKKVCKDKCTTDDSFSDKFRTWVNKNDYQTLSDEEQFELAAKQHAYLLTNKVLFYEVVREQTPDSISTESGFPLDSLVGETTVSEIDSHLDRKFDKIIEEIDYEPIFRPDASLFEHFPHNRKTRTAIAELVQNVESRSITEIREDLLGEIYEELIPAEERKSLGQYYTHPRIAETIVRWAVPNSTTNNKSGDNIPRVLDPACGSGTFTVEAYQQIRRENPDCSHRQAINHITSVDINRFPLHLTSLNLASQSITEPTETIHAHHTSLFDIDPETKYIQSTRLGSESTAGDQIGTFDAVVGNPPYIRQEDLYPDKEHFRSHLTTFGSNRGTPYYDGYKKLSKKSDAYVYFATHSTQFLKEGGRLGFIIPTKWLMTDYGKSFQQFLFDHYKLTAVVGFSARAFEDALVDTALLLIERCQDSSEREKNITKFIRISDEMEAKDIVDSINSNKSVKKDEIVIDTNSDHRTIAMKQESLSDRESGKIGHYLTVPQDIIKIIENRKLIQLDDIAEVKYGNKTGANKFFFLNSEDLGEWQINNRFLTPAVKSIKDTSVMSIDESTTDKYLLDVHDYVEEVQRNHTFGSGSDLTNRVKRSLEQDGYNTLKQYIEHGEREGYHKRNTCASRPVWFDLGDLERPEILHPKFFNDRIMPMWNRDRLAPSNAVDGVYLDTDISDKFMIGVLNSTLHKIFLECWGRAEGGGALQLMTYEMETLPIPDPREFSESGKSEIKQAVDMLVENINSEEALRKIDETLLDWLDVDIQADELRQMRTAISQARIQGSDEVNVLIEEIDTFDTTGSQSIQTGEQGGDRKLEEF